MTTTIIVILVTTSVGKLGPVVGGLLAGLPIGLGPGFYFLIYNVSVDFLVQTVTFSLLALSATQLFLFTYIKTANRGFPITSLAISVVVWVLVLTGLKQFPITALFASLLFVCMTCVTYMIGRRYLMPKSQIERREGLWMLLVRASMGGLIVAIATVTAPLLGGQYTGMILAFPIGYALISVTVHEQYGVATVISVVHSAILGTIGLATFCIAFIFCLQNFAEMPAFLIGLTASITATCCIILLTKIKRT